jgi:glutamate/tyrosine decarboxylase-like PLP-dependent enzyme
LPAAFAPPNRLARVDSRTLLHDVAERAADWFDELPHRPVGPQLTTAELRITDRLQDEPLPDGQVIADLARDAGPGLGALGSPRFFGFVIGGNHPAGVAADWLATTWDQAAGLVGPTPSASAVEDIAGHWLADLLGIPPTASFALVTGCQMAHVTALAAARHRVLADVGHDVERLGLVGAPAMRILAGAERHVTVDRALRILGLGTGIVESVDVDEHGAMRADALAAALAVGEPGTPTIVIAQVGNVNTGAIDPMREICADAKAAGAWVHVDGAFGLWAAASRRRRGTVAGTESADSWATDAHKWLQVPYDCGIAFVRDREAHRAAMAVTAAYLVQDAVGPREPMDWTPEFSRRARGLAVYAVLRALGREGVAELVDRLCACAERFAERLPEVGFELLAHGLNQVLVALPSDAQTDAALAAIQAEGTCWPSATTWRGRRCIRVSVCSHLTTFADVDRSVAAMAAAARG